MNAVHADYFEKVVELCTELQPERVQQILQSSVDIHLQKVSIWLGLLHGTQNIKWGDVGVNYFLGWQAIN